MIQNTYKIEKHTIYKTQKKKKKITPADTKPSFDNRITEATPTIGWTKYKEKEISPKNLNIPKLCFKNIFSNLSYCQNK